MKIKRGDTILVVAGKDRGKTGKVERVLPTKNSVRVEGINVFKKHARPTRRNPHGGIIDINRPITASNVMVICPHCGKAARIGYKTTEKGKIRVCRKCGESTDQE